MFAYFNDLQNSIGQRFSLLLGIAMPERFVDRDQYVVYKIKTLNLGRLSLLAVNTHSKQSKKGNLKNKNSL